jgi:hypothetical protein
MASGSIPTSIHLLSLKLTVLAIISLLLAFLLYLASFNPSSFFLNQQMSKHSSGSWECTIFIFGFSLVFLASFSLSLMLAKARDPLLGMTAWKPLSRLQNVLWLLLFPYIIHFLLPCFPSPLMPGTLMLVLFSNKKLVAAGSPSSSSHTNFPLPKPGTPPFLAL